MAPDNGTANLIHECSDPNCKIGIYKTFGTFGCFLVGGVVIAFLLLYFHFTDTVATKADATELVRIRDAANMIDKASGRLDEIATRNRELIRESIEGNKLQGQCIEKLRENFEYRIHELEMKRK